MVRECPHATGCPLGGRPVWGNGDPHATIMLIGEAPGENEDRKGVPFVGKAGHELDGLYLDKCAGLARERVYVTNTVLCRPPRNETPDTPLRDYCAACHLYDTIAEVNPSYIGVMGDVAMNAVLGMDGITRHHGKVYEWQGRLVMPLYHPAYGLHNTALMRWIMDDFAAFGRMVRGQERPYTLSQTPLAYSEDWLEREVGEVIGVDTESEGARIWSVQVSPREGRAWFMEARNETQMERLRRVLSDRDPLVVLHNAPFDLRMLAQVGVYPRRYTDTMSMAYLLGHEALGLKVLAYRLAGMVLTPYATLVQTATQSKAGAYLQSVAEREWQNPAPVREITADGGMRVKLPTNIGKRVRNYLRKVEKGTAKQTPYDYWHKTVDEADRNMVVDAIGDMGYGYLSEIPRADAIAYACADADATRRCWVVLNEIVQNNGVSGALARDMEVMPMVTAMMDTGMGIDTDYLRGLSHELDKEADAVLCGIHDGYGRWVNPNSAPQVVRYLGACGITVTNTDSDSLDVYGDNKGVKLIQDYRHLVKVKSTYADALVRQAREGRVHTTFSLTRTETGRLASCLPHDVIVSTNRGNIPLGDINPNDYVFTHKQTWRKVNEVYYNGEQEVFSITLTNGFTIECTANHRLLTSHGWLSLEDIYERVQTGCSERNNLKDDCGYVPWGRETNDREFSIGVVCWSPFNTQVYANIREVHYVGTKPVFDLEVDSDHCFLANGIFVHNSQPNLQNIPTRTDTGKRVRRGFVAGDGMTLLSMDYSQIEMRLAAHVSQDPYMMEVFNGGLDIHTETAARMFGVPAVEVDSKTQRYPAKRVGFGVLYGISAPGLLDVFHHEGVHGFTERQCQEFIDAWFRTYPGVVEWIDRTAAFIRREGYVADMFGRRRWIPEVRSTMQWLREAGIRQGVNAPIQSGATGIMKEAMIRLMEHVRAWNGLGVRVLPISQVHDEVMFEVEEEWVGTVICDFKRVMEGAVPLSVPTPVDAEVGRNWEEMKEWKEVA